MKENPQKLTQLSSRSHPRLIIPKQYTLLNIIGLLSTNLRFDCINSVGVLSENKVHVFSLQRH